MSEYQPSSLITREPALGAGVWRSYPMNSCEARQSHHNLRWGDPAISHVIPNRRLNHGVYRHLDMLPRKCVRCRIGLAFLLGVCVLLSGCASGSGAPVDTPVVPCVVVQKSKVRGAHTNPGVAESAEEPSQDEPQLVTAGVNPIWARVGEGLISFLAGFVADAASQALKPDMSAEQETIVIRRFADPDVCDGLLSLKDEETTN